MQHQTSGLMQNWCSNCIVFYWTQDKVEEKQAMRALLKVWESIGNLLTKTDFDMEREAEQPFCPFSMPEGGQSRKALAQCPQHPWAENPSLFGFLICSIKWVLYNQYCFIVILILSKTNDFLIDRENFFFLRNKNYNTYRIGDEFKVRYTQDIPRHICPTALLWLI